VPILQALVITLRQRPWTDERHLAAEHVDELGQLVERVAPEPATDAGETRIVADLNSAPVASL